MGDLTSEPQWQLLTALLSLPSLLAFGLIFMAICLSCYVKFATVFGVVRIGLGFDSLPSALVTSGLTIGLSLFVMYPTLNSCGSASANFLSNKHGAISPKDQTALIQIIATEWGKFLLNKTPVNEIEKFSKLANELDGLDSNAKSQNPSNLTKVVPQVTNSLRIVIPAFIISQLKTAFATAISVFLPFLIIDFFVASILASLELTQLNPLTVALPLKLLLFVVIDGWSLIASGLVNTFSVSI